MAEYESGPETVSRILSAYEIGRKLKHLRLRKKIALASLGKHTGLSASMLSQLETGRLTPTLPTLARIAMVFDVGLEYFFGSRRRTGLFELVRNNERMRFPNRPDAKRPAFYFEVLAFKANNKPLEAYLAEFPYRTPEEAVQHLHGGMELVHLIEGKLGIVYQNEEHVLNAGDSAYFDPSELHAYRGISRKPARALVIATSPVSR